MNNDFPIKQKVLFILASIGLVISITTYSYAYFLGFVSNNSRNSIVTSGVMEITYIDGDKIDAINNFLPGNFIEKNFSVENTGNVDATYDIYLNELFNDFATKSDLVYTLTSNDGGVSINETVFPSTEDKIASNIPIEVNKTHHYTLRVTFKETGIPQDDNKGKTFSTKIGLEPSNNNSTPTYAYVYKTGTTKNMKYSTNHQYGEYISGTYDEYTVVLLPRQNGDENLCTNNSGVYDCSSNTTVGNYGQLVGYYNDISLNTEPIYDKEHGNYLVDNTYNKDYGYFITSIVIPEKIIPRNTKNWFAGLDNLSNLDLTNLDTRYVTDMSGMFVDMNYSNNGTTFYLNLGNTFYTNRVTDMDSMFRRMAQDGKTVTLNLGDNFDTSNVTNMRAMFSSFSWEATDLTFSLGNKFNTAKVTNMTGMFRGNGQSDKDYILDLGNQFYTSNVTNMNEMFAYTMANNPNYNLNLGEHFDTSNVTDMGTMFKYAGYNSSTFNLNLGNNFDTSKVENMDQMFYIAGYKASTFTLNLGPKFNPSSVTSSSEIFSNTGRTAYFNSNLNIYVPTSEVQSWTILQNGSYFNTSNVVIGN